MATDAGRRTSSPAAARRGLLLAVMCVGMFLVQLDVTVVNVSLPAIRNGFHTSLAGQQWVVVSYAIALASLLLTGGTVGDRFGHKRVVLIGLTVFGLASLACGLSPDLGGLIAARAVQGLGAALLLPGTLAVIMHAFPDRAEQARAVGVWAGVSALALPAGPLLGGALVYTIGWRAVFLVNVPIIAAAIPATIRVITHTVDELSRRLDVWGTLLAALTLAAVVYAAINSGRAGQGLADIGLWVAVTVALGAGFGFLLRERHTLDPLLPGALLRHRGFVGANLVAVAMNLVGIGTIFIATLYVQTVQHRTAFVAGLMLLPLFMPLAVLAPLTGRLTARYGPRPAMTAGLLLGAAGSAALLTVVPSSSYARLLAVLLGWASAWGCSPQPSWPEQYEPYPPTVPASPAAPTTPPGKPAAPSASPSMGPPPEAPRTQPPSQRVCTWSVPAALCCGSSPSPSRGWLSRVPCRIGCHIDDDG